MKKIALTIVALVLVLAISFFVLQSKYAVVVQPKGLLAKQELHLMKINVILMLIIIVPTFFWLLVTAWKYDAKKQNKAKESDTGKGILKQVLLWVIPSLIVLPMAIITWFATHKLDPYRPISEEKPFQIQVVAMNWKWLFIYPEQGIATVNFVKFPAHVPIHFSLAADGSPMNSFWIPQLGGQIYAMTGMITPLHIVADEPGNYSGKAAEINGDGYAYMTFIASATTMEEFDEWVREVKSSPIKLFQENYEELLKASKNHPVVYYSDVEKNLFNKAVMKYMHPSSSQGS